MRLRNFLSSMVLLLTCSGLCIANSDSLLVVLTKEENVNFRADLLLQIAKSNYEQSHDAYLDYSHQALDETEKVGFDNDTLKMKILNNVGCAYSEVNNAELATDYFFQAEVYALKIGDLKYLSNLYNNIGLTFGNIQEYDKSISFHFKSLELKESRNDSLGISISHTNIGAVYYSLKEYSKARESFELSFQISQLIDDVEGVAFGYTNLADVFFVEGDYERALSYYTEYLTRVKELKYNHSILYGYKKIGEIHLKLGNLEDAAPNFEKAYQLAVENNYSWELTNICQQFARLKKQEGDYGQALKYAQEALKHFDSTSSKRKLADLHKDMSEIYEATNNRMLALKHLKIHVIQLDSALQKEKLTAFADMESKYQLELKNKENVFLKNEQALSQEIISKRTITAILATIGFLFLGILVLWLNNIRDAQKKQNVLLEAKVKERTQHLEQLNIKLEQANRELERFFFITSHDLKEPLRNIMSFTSLAKRTLQNEDIPKSLEYFGFVQSGVTQLAGLIEGVTDFFSVTRDDKPTYHSFDQILADAQEKLTFDVPYRILLSEKAFIESYYLPSLLTVVFKNIIENSIRFNESEVPQVQISLWEDQRCLYFSFEDNGIGIPRDYHSQIFEMFKRLHGREVYAGSGLGLPISRKILQLYGGDVKVESNTAVSGSTFVFHVEKECCRVGGINVLVGAK